MGNFLVRVIITAIAVSFAITLVPCITFESDSSLTASIFVLSMFIALINASIKPLLQVLSLPITILTLGLFSVYKLKISKSVNRLIDNGLKVVKLKR